MSSAARFEGSTRSQTASNDAASSWAAPESARPSAVITPALLTDDQSAEFLGVSVRRFHELRAQPWWTVRPVVLGPRLLRWPAAELLAAIASMPRQETKAAEPAALRRAKIERLKSGGRASAINKAEA